MTEPPIKIKHHYVPVCYLKFFTDTQSRDGSLTVIDFDTNKEWASTPEKVACENHYNTVEGDLRPDSFEDIFTVVESGAAPIWNQMIQDRKFPADPEARNWIMNFLALLEVRTKPTRKFIHEFHKKSYQMIMDLVSATPERFERHIEQAKKDGVDIPELPSGVTLEDIRKRIRDGSIEMDADIHNNYYLQQTFEHANIVLELFHDREWAACDLSKSSIDLVTSDDPISIVWTVKMPAMYPPGLGLRNTLIIVPLSPKLVLLGSFETETLKPPGDTRIAQELFVLYLNSITMSQVFRFAYSRSDQIFFQTALKVWNDKKELREFIAKKIEKDRSSQKYKDGSE